MSARGIVRDLLVFLSAVSLGCASGKATVTPTPAQAQGARPGAATKPGGEKSAPPKSFAELTKGSKKYAGLFTIYQDTTTGALLLAVQKDQVGKEFIYFSVTTEGALPAGSFRGSFGPNTIFAVRKNFNKIEFVTQNTNYYFNPASPLSRAADANISPGMVASIEIAAIDSATGAYLVKADDLFLTEALRQIKPSPRPGTPSTPPATPTFSLGTLSKSKTHVVSIKSYPLNTDVVVTYVYENPAPTARGGPEITDPRNVSLTIQHSFIEMPVNDFKPRYADPRVGYFTNEVTDQTSTAVTPWMDPIHRWNLVKKNPDAPLSDPVEPITFWIENTTPLELRPAIRAGVLRWNEAFETAGFTNAIVVKEQPDTATWDAGDLRYNVLRWTASPNPPFGGYGPSFVNPRTGQILGADIMLEFVFVTNRLVQSKLFDYAGQALVGPDSSDDTATCDAPALFQEQEMFGATALALGGASQLEVDDYLYQSVQSLVLHEVGHTLGLNHNMKASQMLSPAELQDSALVAQRGISGSVMDYHAVNLAPPGAHASPGHRAAAFDTHPGPYDRWAIEFGYRPSLPDSAAEAARVAALLAKSTEPQLAFGNDADDMRSPGGGIDPRVMVGDLSNDVLTWAAGRMTLSDTLLKGLERRYPEVGQDYASLVQAYQVVTGQKATAAVVVSRYIGGVYVSRGVDGQPGPAAPFEPVSLADQQRAMGLLRTRFFAPDAWNASPELLDRLQKPRRGFSGPGEPDIHGRVLAAQRSVLQFLLAPQTQARLTDSRLYGNKYSDAQMMMDLTDAIFAADARGNVNTFRQNLQLEYVTELAAMVKGPAAKRYDYVSKSAAVASLKRIQAQVSPPTGDAETRAHRQHVALVISAALDSRS
jgi:hypothetical protein